MLQAPMFDGATYEGVNLRFRFRGDFMKRFQPSKQGGLDNLCGLYCIINAVRFFEANSKHRSEDAELFKRLIEILSPLMSLSGALVNGIPLPKLRSLAIAAGADSKVKFSVTPLKQFSRFHRLQSIVDVSRRVCEQGGVVLCHLEPTQDHSGHWTLIIRATEKRLYLLDSSNFPSYFNTSRIGRAQRIDTEEGLVFVPTGI